MYFDLVERILISYICDLLRPHSQGEIIKQYFNKKIWKDKSGKTKTKVYPRYTNHKLHKKAKLFFRPNNSDFTDLCDACNINPSEILKIIDHCVANDLDRLHGKRAIRAYFNLKRRHND